MTWVARTLWDLIAPPSRRRRRGGRRDRPSAPGDAARSALSTVAEPRARPRPGSMQARYDALVEEMKATHRVRVRKWRTSTSGCAWEVHYRDGTTVRLIEAPRPRGPMSCAVFLHEIGHHAIGFGQYRPRCLEEYHAWRWALESMRAYGFRVTPAVEKRMHEAMRYALAKAQRRGLKRVPAVLVEYLGEGA